MMRLAAAAAAGFLATACTGTEASAPDNAKLPAAVAQGEGCASGAAEQRSCQFIAAVQSDAELFNQESVAAQDGEPLPRTNWRIERCDYQDPAVVECTVGFDDGSSQATFSLVATNAEAADGRLVLLEGTTAEYAVERYRVSAPAQ